MTNNTSPAVSNRAVRAGVFASLDAAESAVHQLLAAGFTADDITVVCSDGSKEKHFRAFEHQQPAGANTPAAATAGGAVGAVMGGATAVAAGIVAGGLPLVIVGGTGLLTGGVVGGFLGAMLTRGVEKEAANYYDQAVEDGMLLVTVERHEAQGEPSLACAEEVLTQAGAKPLSLPEG
jgi:hypothetical protein